MPEPAGVLAGWTWVPRAEVETLTCRARDVFAALAAINGIEPLEEAVPAPFVPVGSCADGGCPSRWCGCSPTCALSCSAGASGRS